MSTNTYLTKFPYEQELIEFCAEKDQKSINKKIGDAHRGIPKTKEHNQKVSAAKKIRTHCCIICKQSFNPGNWARHYH
jgi:hypothetical protein